MTLEELVIKLVSRGGPQATAEVDKAEKSVQRLQQRAKSAAPDLANLTSGLRDSFESPTSIATEIGAIGSAVALFTGVGYAAKMQQIEVGFNTLLGSASRASSLMKELSQFALETPFDSLQLAEYARQLLATGVAADRLMPTMKSIADTTAALGGGDMTFGRIALALRQVRQSRQLQGDELTQLTEAGVPIDRIIAAGSGRTFGGGREGIEYLQSMSGAEAYEVLVRGMEKAFPDMARKMAESTLIGMAQNLGDAAKQVLLPTGKLLLPPLMAATKALGTMVGFVSKINDATFGLPGLVIATGLLVAAFARLAARLALLDGLLGATAATGVGAGIGGTAANAAGGFAAASIGSRLISWLKGAAFVGGAGGLRAGLGAAAGTFGAYFPKASTLGKFGLGLGLGLGGDYLHGQASKAAPGSTGEYYGHLGGNMLQGAAVGATLLSLIPGIGTLLGGLLGAGAGALKTMWDYSGSGSSSSSTDAATEELRKQTKVLQEISGTLIGGGPRAEAAKSRTELEIALMRYGMA